MLTGVHAGDGAVLREEAHELVVGRQLAQIAELDEQRPGVRRVARVVLHKHLRTRLSAKLTQ